MASRKNPEEKAAPERLAEHPVERTKFRSLLLGNPNYFGTVKVSPFKPVKPMAGNTTYEELKCVGFNPDMDRLKAVVWVKLNSGYSGGLCSSGSQEYVRFYLSFDNGANWEDQGVVSFTTYDLPGKKPLEYAVTLHPKTHWTWCTEESLPRVRAILSWTDPPPPNQPDWVPVWGNIVEAHIQIRPIRIIFLGDLFEHYKIKLPENIEEQLDLKQPIKAAEPKPLSVSQLQALYKEKGVQGHRYLYPVIKKYLANPELPQAYKAYGSQGVLAGLGLDIAAIIAALEKTDGDTGYEELGCVGLDPNAMENLVATLKIKRSYGYSGAQCQGGSQEYVAFWVDWEDGSGWHWAGTAQVHVHDFSTIPADGLQYAVAQPINLAAHRKPCDRGEVTARVRAILSWEAAPPIWDPDYKPTWGNRIETRVHIPPGVGAKPGDYKPYLEDVCGVPVCSIDQATGFAPVDRPFGGTVSFQGQIPGAPNVSTPEPNRPRYRLSVSNDGGATWQHLTDSFGVTLDEYLNGGGIVTSTPVTQSVDGNDYYTYQEAPVEPGLGWRTVNPPRLLGYWNTAGKTGLWQVKVEALDPVTNTPFVAGQISCVVDGTTRQNVIIDLDNDVPVTSLSITDVSHDGGATWDTAGECQTFKVGDVIRGSYSVSDAHFGSFSLTVQPAASAHGAAVDPASRAYPVVPSGGETGTWTLNTTGMDPCGYVIWMDAVDRTIVNCDGPWENETAFVGFCLVA